MLTRCSQPVLPDRAVPEKIRVALARSPIFRDARISEPASTPSGAVCLDIRFQEGPVVFRVLAPTAERVYSLLDHLVSDATAGDGGG